LGAPKFLFHADRIDQIAAATAVASTDRSTSRSPRRPSKKEEKALQRKPSISINNLMN
jgi:hypothetical protein